MEDGRLVKGAVGAQGDCLHALGQIGHGLCQHAHVAAARRDVPVAELLLEAHVRLGPEDDAGVVALRPVVGHGRGVLVTLHERRIHIESRSGFPGAALEARHQRAIGTVQPGEGGRLPGDSRGGPGRPERPLLGVERLAEVPDGGRRRQRVPEEGGHRVILAERGEILAAIPAARPERDEALDEWRGRQAALSLLDRDMRIDHGRDPELAEQLDRERDPRAAWAQRGIDRVIDLERQPQGRIRHRVPPWDGRTHWVNPSKGDASAPRPSACGLDCDPPGKP